MRFNEIPSIVSPRTDRGRALFSGTRSSPGVLPPCQKMKAAVGDENRRAAEWQSHQQAFSPSYTLFPMIKEKKRKWRGMGGWGRSLPNKREAADSSGFVSFSGGLPSLPSCPANRLPYPGAAMSSASPSRSARQRDLEIEGEREREQERQGE